MEKKVQKLFKINFNIEPIYGDNDKYIRTKIKIYGASINTNFQGKKMPKEKVQYNSFINNNVRFSCQSKEKVLSSNTLGRMQIGTKKDKNGKPYR